MKESEVTMTVEGKTYSGTYEVAGGVVTVRTAYGSRSTQIGGSPPDVVAGWLLRELVEAEKGRKDSML